MLFTFDALLYITYVVGFFKTHHLLVSSGFSPLSLLMSYNSSTSPLSCTNSENGDNDHDRQNSNVRDSSKPSGSHTVGGGRGDHPRASHQKRGSSYAQAMKFGVGCSHHSQHSPTSQRINPALSPFDPVVDPETGLHEVCALFGSKSHQIDSCLELPAQLKVEIVVEKFGGTKVTTPVTTSTSSHVNAPVTIADQWIRMSLKKCIRSTASSSMGKMSPLKPPSTPKVTIVDPVMSPKDLDVPPLYAATHSHVQESPCIGSSHVPPPDTLILAHSDKMINYEQLVNINPLNAMDVDLLDDPNVNDYEDSHDLMLKEEEMADSFLNLEHI
ncbi:hypothetical protein Cgig2_025751 [Carnegiea gigantea]|uniref:Uncharacterized protein n=1 Tax=Carnegiea gigantea TaxID=171969 RepID=A0A9Q1JIT2_9CARY|nr:hypothetical protein Cgig2_025751 [Carnegiea gigantea]